jgi:hypothetical protein
MTEAQKTTDRPQWLVEQEAAAFREVAPYLDRLQLLSQRLGWPLGRPVIQSAVEQLEQDHRQAGGASTDGGQPEDHRPEAVKRRPCDCTEAWAMACCHHTNCKLRRGGITPLVRTKAERKPAT